MCCWLATSLKIVRFARSFSNLTPVTFVCFRFFTPGFSKGKEICWLEEEAETSGQGISLCARRSITRELTRWSSLFSFPFQKYSSAFPPKRCKRNDNRECVCCYNMFQFYKLVACEFLFYRSIEFWNGTSLLEDSSECMAYILLLAVGSLLFEKVSNGIYGEQHEPYFHKKVSYGD